VYDFFGVHSSVYECFWCSIRVTFFDTDPSATEAYFKNPRASRRATRATTTSAGRQTCTGGLGGLCGTYVHLFCAATSPGRAGAGGGEQWKRAVRAHFWVEQWLHRAQLSRATFVDVVIASDAVAS